jgi:tetratricopeptide (TPR) repeat protein
MARAERRLLGSAGDVVARYEEACALAVHQGDRARELAIRNSLGIVHWERGQYADAVREYEAALRVCRDTSDTVHEGLILNSLGASLNKLRRWDEARTTLMEAIRVTADTEERQLHAHALAALADAYIGREHFGDALESLEQSLAIRVALGDRRGEGWMQEKIARASRALGAHQEADLAAAAALHIAQELHDDALCEALRVFHSPFTR